MHSRRQHGQHVQRLHRRLQVCCSALLLHRCKGRPHKLPQLGQPLLQLAARLPRHALQHRLPTPPCQRQRLCRQFLLLLLWRGGCCLAAHCLAVVSAAGAAIAAILPIQHGLQVWRGGGGGHRTRVAACKAAHVLNDPAEVGTGPRHDTWKQEVMANGMHRCSVRTRHHPPVQQLTKPPSLHPLVVGRGRAVGTEQR